MWTNRTKAQIDAGKTVYGPFIRFPGPLAIEQAALAGFDFVLIDGEHSSLTLAQVETMIYAAYAAGITPLVRWPEASRQAFQRLLDMGVQGIMVPHVDTEAEARTIGRAARFAPAGERGMAGPVLGNGWGALSPAETAAYFDRQVLTLAQIESLEALEILDQIAAQPGIDILFVGPLDLSQAMGIPGEVTHPRLLAAIDQVIAAAARAGKQTGIYVGTPEAGQYWKERGVRFIATGLDTVLLKQAFTSLRAALG
ncbi:MAG TPA: aldolase/citrate lyase family protein [Symbiobacteriaceae bacterium]|jgi:4-hydroxy-2-oxoheptanedioate aldolase